MDLPESAERFIRAMSYCDDLVKVHQSHGGPSPGRRAEETSLNRAIVVLSVAAWQSAVQDLATTTLNAARSGVGGVVSQSTFQFFEARAANEIKSFSTPNSENVERLLRLMGFDPRPHWTWEYRGGQGIGMVTLRPQDVEDRMRDWLRLRHDIAHGHPELSAVTVLQSVRQKPSPPASGSPSTRLVDAKSCVAFFRRVTELTGDALAGHLGAATVRWRR